MMADHCYAERIVGCHYAECPGALCKTRRNLLVRQVGRGSQWVGLPISVGGVVAVVDLAALVNVSILYVDVKKLFYPRHWCPGQRSKSAWPWQNDLFVEGFVNTHSNCDDWFLLWWTFSKKVIINDGNESIKILQTSYDQFWVLVHYLESTWQYLLAFLYLKYQGPVLSNILKQ